MRNPLAHLLTDTEATMKVTPTRDGFGIGVVEVGKEDPRIVVLCADLKESTRSDSFEKTFPERFVEVGIAEQHMAGLAAGMALAGKIPYIASYAAFNPGRNYEQIRTTIALSQTHVVVCGMHAGVSVGPDGATHQMLEDIGLMRMLPHMTVIVPADAEEARKAIHATAALPGPSYIRFGRSPVPVFTTPETPFEVGKALSLYTPSSPSAVLCSTGSLSYTALRVAEDLAKEGVEIQVLHMPFVKPLDTQSLLAVALKTRRVVTLEEHQIAGGFGSAVAECLSELCPVPLLRLGINDQFGQSGTPDELLTHFGLDQDSITQRVRSWIQEAL